MSKKILIIDDEPSIVTLLKYNLEQSGFTIIAANNGIIGKQLAIHEQPDLILLDIMLPELDGIEVCKQLREEKVFIPIMMLTAKGEEFDRIIGLELGADDYMVKPFSPREVVTRVKALLRRVDFVKNMSVPSDRIKRLVVGELEIFPENYEAFFCKNKMELTRKEFDLLHFMVLHKDKTIHREELLQNVWNYQFIGDSRIVDVHISHLREKMDAIQQTSPYIKTIRGVGYRLEESKK